MNIITRQTSLATRKKKALLKKIETAFYAGFVLCAGAITVNLFYINCVTDWSC